MHGGIIKFHSLTDPDRTGSQDNNFLLARIGNRFVFLRIGGVIVRNVCIKLRRTGVNCLVHRMNCFFFTERVDLCFRAMPESRHRAIGKAVFFAVCQFFTVKWLLCKLLFQCHNMRDSPQKKPVDRGCGKNFIHTHAAPHQLRDHHQSVIRCLGDVGAQFLLRHRLCLLRKQVICARFQRTHCLQKTFLKGSSHAHNLARCLHLRGKPVACAGKFIKREARHFGDNVVQCRFKAGRCVGQADFLQAIPDGNLRGNPRNREAACFACQCRGT